MCRSDTVCNLDTQRAGGRGLWRNSLIARHLPPHAPRGRKHLSRWVPCGGKLFPSSRASLQLACHQIHSLSIRGVASTPPPGGALLRSDLQNTPPPRFFTTSSLRLRFSTTYSQKCIKHQKRVHKTQFLGNLLILLRTKLTFMHFPCIVLIARHLHEILQVRTYRTGPFHFLAARL